ncbi:MAG: putative glycoside hydrolase [Chloroflexota bacterium]
MSTKRHDLLPSLSFFTLLGFLLLSLLFMARQSVEVRVYDARTGYLLPHAAVENTTPARRQSTPTGAVFLGVNRRLSVNVSAPGFLPARAVWQSPHLWTLHSLLRVSLLPTQLTGQVRDARTGLPLAGATATIDAQQSITGDAGQFRLENVIGDASLLVERDGYRPWQGAISWQTNLLDGQMLIVDLLPDEVTGQVRRQDSGQPVPGVMVFASGQQVRTDVAGRFVLHRLERGDPVAVNRYGFWPAEVTYDGHPLDIHLQPDGVEGLVRWAETGQPLAGVTVSAGDQQWVTQADGRFRLHRLRQGDSIHLTCEGYWPRELIYEALPVDVSLQDRRVRVLVRSALDDVALTGLEVWREGRPLAAVSPGTFELPACRSDEWLEASADGHLALRVAPCAAIDETTATVQHLQVLLQPRPLTVTVRDAYAGWPLAGATVAASLTRTTDALGQAALAPAMPGMAVAVDHPGYAATTARYDGQSSEMTVSLVPASIRGMVIDAVTGRPLAGAALRRDGQTLLRTGDDGLFYLAAYSPMTMTVRLPGYRLTQVRIDAPPLSAVPVNCPDTGQDTALCWQIGLEPFQVRGVYIPFGLLYARERTLAILDMVSTTGLNAVVVDVKGDRGYLAYASELDTAVELGVSARGVMDIHEFLDLCHQRGIYTVARLVVFKDNPLSHGRPDLAVKQADGTVWLDREKLGWANPYREEVWEYNIGIAREVALLGFDEIQLDYVRFPSDGDLNQIVYEQEDSPDNKATAIRTFVARMQQALEAYDVFLSADVFGLTLVVEPQSGMGIGQRVIDIAPHVDYLCPMVYPSTFIPGNLGLDNPSLHPYQVVSQSLLRGMELTSTLIRPWLQAYSLGGVTYDLVRQARQRFAAEAVGAWGWTYWNASGRYDERLFASLDDIRHNADGKSRSAE